MALARPNVPFDADAIEEHYFLAMRNHTQAYTNTMIGDLEDMTKRLEGIVVPEEIIGSATRRRRTPAASPSDDSLTFI